MRRWLPFRDEFLREIARHEGLGSIANPPSCSCASPPKQPPPRPRIFSRPPLAPHGNTVPNEVSPPSSPAPDYSSSSTPDSAIPTMSPAHTAGESHAALPAHSEAVSEISQPSSPRLGPDSAIPSTPVASTTAHSHAAPSTETAADHIADYQCRDCHGHGLHCAAAIVDLHRRDLPLHRLEVGVDVYYGFSC